MKEIRNKYPLSSVVCGIIIFLSIYACSSNNNEMTVVHDTHTISNPEQDSIPVEKINNDKYELNDFIKKTLPNKLIEISGLTIDHDNDEIFAINDEKGILYRLSKDGELISEERFGKKADYEGIEKVAHSIYILKSNGKIIEYSLTQSKKISTHGNPLKISNDTEGLGYDPLSNSLLIACKGSSTIKENKIVENVKSVYAFDLNNKTFSPEPLLSISDEDIIEYLKNNDQNLSTTITNTKRLRRATSFSPSAIAVHPIEHSYYILSSVGKTLIVLNRHKTIDRIYFLDDNAYIQPEGIAFDNKGNMYISNEGKRLNANLLKIEYVD